MEESAFLELKASVLVVHHSKISSTFVLTSFSGIELVFHKNFLRKCHSCSNLTVLRLKYLRNTAKIAIIFDTAKCYRESWQHCDVNKEKSSVFLLIFLENCMYAI